MGALAMADSSFAHQATERMRILVELQSLAAESDAEKAHCRADDLLIEYLRLIGADDMADAWARARGER